MAQIQGLKARKRIAQEAACRAGAERRREQSEGGAPPWVKQSNENLLFALTSEPQTK